MANTAVSMPTMTATGIPVYPNLNSIAVNPNASIDVGKTILIVHEYLIGLSGRIGILKNQPNDHSSNNCQYVTDDSNRYESMNKHDKTSAYSIYKCFLFQLLIKEYI